MVYAVVGQLLTAFGGRILTSCDLVDFMLKEEIGGWHKSTEEQACEYFAVLDGLRIGRTQSQTAKRPGYGDDKVGDHEDVVPVMVIGRCYIGPASTCECPEDAHASNDPGKVGIRSPGQVIP